MLDGTVSPASDRIRAGSRALSVFAHSLNATVLRVHQGGSLRPYELERTIGWAPQSSLRAAVGNMCDLGALERLDPADGSPAGSTQLTGAGLELLPVADTLEHWLSLAPGGPIPLDSAAAQGTVRVLTAGWDSTMVRALAERPLTLTELNDAIAGLSYPALKRRLSKLRSTSLVTPVGRGKSAAYAASDWLRQAVIPLAVAGRWELIHDPGAEPITRFEVEAAFLLTLPLVELPDDASGSCTLAVVLSEDQFEEREVAGVAAEVRRGRIASCESKSASAPTTWALGTAGSWLDALIHGRGDALRIGGSKPLLAEGIVKCIHATLFRS